MSKTKIDCCDSDLQAFLHGQSVAPDEAVMEHIEQCSACQERLESLAAEEQLWQRAGFALRQSSSRPTEWDSTVSIGAQRFRVASDDSPQWNDAMARQLLSPPTHPEMLGRLGRYEVESTLGSGGMGIVFKAFDTELNRPVAIKLLAPHLARSQSARTRFSREARAAAGIVDDHVVPIYNVDSEAESPFLVMQYVAGGSLQQRLDCDGPLELCEILRIGLQTAQGLAAAHAQGLIHRDVKPSNVLLDEDVSRALLSDFGLARTDDDQQLTHSGFHPGTPQYMSPEQVRGEALDGRSDLFSLGCLLHALCTGEPPFRGNSSFATLRMITDEPTPSISEKRPELPDWLEAIVKKLLEKSPQNRYQSASEVATLLESCLAHARSPDSCLLPQELLKAEGTGNRAHRRRAIVAAGFFSFLLILASITIIVDWKKGQITFKFDEAKGNKSSTGLRVGETERGSKKSTSNVDALSGASQLEKWNKVSPATTLTVNEAIRRGKELRHSRQRVRIQFKIGSALSRLRRKTNGEESEWVVLKSKAGADFNDVEDFYVWVPVELASHAMVGKWLEVEGIVVGSRTGGKRLANDPRPDVPLFSISVKSPDQMRIQNGPFQSGRSVEIETELRTQAMPTQVLFTGDAINGATIIWKSGTVAKQVKAPSRKNLEQDEVYRLEISGIPGHEGLTLSPTLEVRAASPATSAYLQHNAVPFEITADDLDQVGGGKFVTKVIYLPNPDSQTEAIGGVATLVSYRLDLGIDPVKEAELDGNILLILRMGSKKS
ncbi:MAG: serine/threonine-protein kinase [Planctomycetota bacterium]